MARKAIFVMRYSLCVLVTCLIAWAYDSGAPPDQGHRLRSNDDISPPFYAKLAIDASFASRRVVDFDVTAHPADAWVAQQLREATPVGQAPRFLIRDRHSKYGEAFARVAKGSMIEILKTPHRAPKAIAICERFLGGVRRECLDPVLVFSIVEDEGHCFTLDGDRRA